MIWGAIRRTTVSEFIAWVLVSASLAVVAVIVPLDSYLTAGRVTAILVVASVLVYRWRYPRRRRAAAG